MRPASPASVTRSISRNSRTVSTVTMWCCPWRAAPAFSSWPRCTTPSQCCPRGHLFYWVNEEQGTGPNAARPAASAFCPAPADLSHRPLRQANAQRPCGGSENGKCEISILVGHDVACGWHLIFERLKKLGRLESFRYPSVDKDWSLSRDGGPREIIKEDSRQ